MADKLVQVGSAQAHYSTRGDRILKYSVEISHLGLREHKLITAPEFHMLETKANLQLAKWQEQWRQTEQKREIREKKVANAQEAEHQTSEAQKRLSELEGILHYTLNINDTIDWDTLKVNNRFSEERPIQPVQPEPKTHGPQPDRTWC